MDIGLLEATLSKALNHDEMAVGEYADQIVEYLKDKPDITTEFLSVVIEGVPVDQCANFFDFLQECDKGKVQEICSLIRKNQAFKLNQDGIAYQFLCATMGFLITAPAAVQSMWTLVIGMLPVKVSVNTNSETKLEHYDLFFKESVIELIMKGVVFPEWSSIKTTGDIITRFVKLVNQIIDSECIAKDKSCANAVFELKHWLLNGEKNARERKITQEVKEKDQPSKAEELFKLAEHYKRLEEDYAKNLKELSALRMKMTDFQTYIDKIESENHRLEADNVEKEKTVEQLKDKLDTKAEKLDESKKLSKSLDVYRRESEQALLIDIANALKNSYIDFKESENEEMDIEMGEMYKVILRNVFKTLESKKIKME